jgi:hypothetical protein
MYKQLFITGMIIAMTTAILSAGCITLREFTETATSVPIEEITKQAQASETIISNYVEEPYQTGGALAIGYVLALLRQLYKKKKREQANNK